MVGINRTIELDPILKEYIDNGPEENILEDIKALNDIGNIPVNLLHLVYSSDIPWQGYVFNRGMELNQNDWEMGLNLILAYNKWNDESQSFVPMPLTTQGELGYTIVHEFGHIMTLNAKTEIDTTVRERENCDNLLLEEGCFHDNAAINLFNNEFYISDQKYNEPNFVTEYAKTNIAEDIAESFTYFVGQKNINKINQESSGALRKINLVAEYDLLKELKTPFVSKLSSGQEFFIVDKPIHKFNRTNDGKLISCTDFKTIKKLFDKHKKLRK